MIINQLRSFGCFRFTEKAETKRKYTGNKAATKRQFEATYWHRTSLKYGPIKKALLACLELPGNWSYKIKQTQCDMMLHSDKIISTAYQLLTKYLSTSTQRKKINFELTSTNENKYEE